MLTISDIRIRRAAEADMPAIHKLVCELAVYEKAPEAVVTTPEEYLRDFLEGRFDCFVAEGPEGILGMALFFVAYSTWKGKMIYLDDLIVTETHRRKGIGRRLFEAVIEEGRRIGCRLIKWQVLDWNEPAIAFYRTYGATIETDWWNGKIYL
ncbi:MAG: GNAT family N-acetyltransferase [Saprospiraceae bacterium]|nr:GNAT family N-acetyltransferase [Saprospiraceae bacterium]MDW8485140.1 GNAT family N-acetyltransferase [Saprospiraceae bacterium]